MNQISFYQQIIIPITQWVLFACGVKLYVVGISSLLGVLVWCFFVIKMNLWRLLYHLLKQKVTEKISYMKEIFPYQWKIALSWISGYFIFQLFNPVLFATEGAIVAGQMGMTVHVLSAIQGFALSWQNTKIPKYCGLIEMKQFNTLDTLFNKTLKQMLLICGSMLVVFFSVIALLRMTNFTISNNVLADRFLDYIPMFVMMIPLFLNQFIGSWATYLRCHKQEPFLINSVVVGALCCLSTFILGNKFGLYGITVGYCSIITFISFPWAYRIFTNKKKEWHGK